MRFLCNDKRIGIIPRTGFQPGDILAFSGTNVVSHLIRWGTWSRFSHVAICCRHESEIYAVESTTLREIPCALTGKQFSGVQVHRPKDLMRADSSRVWVYRPFYPVWSDQLMSESLTKFLLGAVGRPYDYRGAVRSASTFLKMIHPESLERVFCSELIAAALKHIHIFPSERNASNITPGRLIHDLRASETYDWGQRIK